MEQTINLNHIFVLYYRSGRNPHSMQSAFLMPTDDLQKAISEGQRHCQAMNYRFSGVDPFIVDFKKKEERM